MLLFECSSKFLLLEVRINSKLLYCSSVDQHPIALIMLVRSKSFTNQEKSSLYHHLHSSSLTFFGWLHNELFDHLQFLHHSRFNLLLLLQFHLQLLYLIQVNVLLSNPLLFPYHPLQLIWVHLWLQIWILFHYHPHFLL